MGESVCQKSNRSVGNVLFEPEYIKYKNEVWVVVFFPYFSWSHGLVIGDDSIHKSVLAHKPS